MTFREEPENQVDSNEVEDAVAIPETTAKIDIETPPNSTNVKTVKITEISDSKEFISKEVNYRVVEEYADLLDRYEGEDGPPFKFPPIYVVWDIKLKRYVIIDGYHRYLAHLLKEIEIIEVIEVTVEEEKSSLNLFLVGFEKNSKQGYPPTLADRKNAAFRILNDPEARLWSNRVIANLVGVNPRTASNYKKEHRKKWKYSVSEKVKYQDANGNVKVKNRKNNSNSDQHTSCIPERHIEYNESSPIEEEKSSMNGGIHISNNMSDLSSARSDQLALMNCVK